MISLLIALAAASSPLNLTIDQAVGMARQNATTVAKAGLNKEVTGAQLLQSYAQFLPNLTAGAALGASAGHSYLTTATPTLVSGTDWGPGLQLQSSINLFNGFADQAGVKAAVERDEAAGWTLARAKEQIAVDVTQAFLQVILDDKLVAIADKNFGVSKQRQELLVEQARIGAKDLATLYRQQAQTSADESALITARNKLHTDQILLARRLKLDPGQELVLTPPDLTKAGGQLAGRPIDDLVRMAVGERKDLKAAGSIASAADQAVAVARAGYYPRLDFGVGAQTVGRTLVTRDVNGVGQDTTAQKDEGSQLKDHLVYTAGLTMSWAVFDRQVVRTQVARAAAEAKAAAIDKDDLVQQVEGEVRQAAGDYQAATKRFDSSVQGLRAAQQAFESVDGRYGVGAASFIDLTTAQTVLAQAQASQAQAQIDLFLESRLIDHAVGLGVDAP